MDEKISENYAKYYTAKSHIPYVSTKSICTAHKYKVTITLLQHFGKNLMIIVGNLMIDWDLY